MTDARTLIHAAGEALLTERRQLTAGELADLAAVPDDSVPALAALAHEVRLAWCGPEVEVEGILSAKTGGCPRTATSAPSPRSSTRSSRPPRSWTARS